MINSNYSFKVLVICVLFCSSSRSSSLFQQDPTRTLIQPYMPPNASNPLYSHGSSPNLHADSFNHSRLQELQIPASAQFEMLQVDQLALFGTLHPNQGPPPLVHKATNLPMEHYRPAFVSPTNQPPVGLYHDHHNWQHQQQDAWMQETEEQKYNSQQLIKKQQKLMNNEIQQKTFITQPKHKNQHQQYQSMPSPMPRQTNLQGQERRSSFQGHSTVHQHHAAAPVKMQRHSSIPCKSRPLPTQSQRQTRIVPSPSQHSLQSNSNHNSAYQQQNSCSRQPVHHMSPSMQRSSHQTLPDYHHHQPAKPEHAQGPARKRPCYQPSQVSQQQVHSEKRMLTQLSQIPDQGPSQSQQIDVPNMLPLPNPEFCKNNEISYPLIYDYLTSAEIQVCCWHVDVLTIVGGIVFCILCNFFGSAGGACCRQTRRLSREIKK